MKATVENVGVLGKEDQARVCSVAARAVEYSSLRSYAAFLKLEFPGWSVYQGDNHIGLHYVERGQRFLLVERD